MALIAAGMCFSPYVLGGLLVADLLIHHRELWQSSKEFAHLLCTDTPEAVAHFYAFCIEMALLHKTTITMQAAGHQAIEAAMLRIRPVLNQLAALARQEKTLALASRGAVDLAAMPHSELVEGMKNTAKMMSGEVKQVTQQGAENFMAATSKIKTAYTKAEISAAKKIAECTEKFTPEIIQLRTERATEWLKAVKAKGIEIGPPAANYQEVFDFIKPYFGESLDGVCLDAKALDKNVFVLFRDTTIPGKAHKNRQQLRIGTKPKTGGHARAGEMMVNLEVGSVSPIFDKTLGEFRDSFQPYSNGHLSVLHPEDLPTIVEKITTIFPVSS